MEIQRNNAQLQAYALWLFRLVEFIDNWLPILNYQQNLGRWS
jgi:hypothetical protein